MDLEDKQSTKTKGKEILKTSGSDVAEAELQTEVGTDLMRNVLTETTLGQDPDDKTIRSKPPWIREQTISGKPYPIEPDVFKFVQMPKTITNHTYRIFSNIPFDPSFRMPLIVGQMNFHEKLYHLLTLDKDSRRDTIEWCFGGRAFCIRNLEGLLRLQLLQSLFGCNNIQRFRKQLNCFGYKRLTREEQTHGYDCYYSEVCAKIPRCPVSFACLVSTAYTHNTSLLFHCFCFPVPSPWSTSYTTVQSSVQGGSCVVFGPQQRTRLRKDCFSVPFTTRKTGSVSRSTSSSTEPRIFYL